MVNYNNIVPKECELNSELVYNSDTNTLGWDVKLDYTDGHPDEQVLWYVPFSTTL